MTRDRASPGCGVEDPGLNLSGGTLASHSAPVCTYYAEHRDYCADPTSSHVQKHCVSMSHTHPPEPQSGKTRGWWDGVLMGVHWGPWKMKPREQTKCPIWWWSGLALPSFCFPFLPSIPLFFLLSLHPIRSLSKSRCPLLSQVDLLKFTPPLPLSPCAGAISWLHEAGWRQG